MYLFNNRFIFLTLLITFVVNNTFSISQYASSVIAFSTQFTATNWSASQATGTQNVYPAYGDNPLAWASTSADGQREFLVLGFATPQVVANIQIYETLAPGAIDTVYLRNASTLVWTAVYVTTAVPGTPIATILTINIPTTGYNVDAIRIAINSPVVPGWNEIDAVQINSSAAAGIINVYTPVTAIGCNNVAVNSVSGFVIGGRVLLIQMQGAAINLTNTSSFGDISPNSAGNYEFATIASITGLTITFVNQLLRSYTVTGSLQLITVPQYTNMTIGTPITAAAWNGSTGGVVVFEATGTVTFSANIDVSDLGFRGATVVNGAALCGSLDYFYTIASGSGARKGEGMISYTTGYEAGRGANANGGGGGNDHNSGGGGGANYSVGGKGGNQYNGFNCANAALTIGGIGGKVTPYSNLVNKVFLGGGGGAGHANESVGSSGKNGGGIVIIRANTIIGNGFSVLADGTDNTTISAQDGSGGGGGGGGILIDATTVTGLTTSVKGGKGGDYSWANIDCIGPGGGGGGGIVWVSSSFTGITPVISGGTSGIATNTVSGCFGTGYGAVAGTNGGTLTGLVLPESNTPCSVLPIELIYFETESECNESVVRIKWATATEINNNFFTVERSYDAQNWEPLAIIKGAGTSNSKHNYSFIDNTHLSRIAYYRLKQTDFDSGFFYSNILAQDPCRRNETFLLYPNPSAGDYTLQLKAKSEGNYTYEVINILGQIIYRNKFTSVSTFGSELTAGVYYIRVYSTDFDNLDFESKLIKIK